MCKYNNHCRRCNKDFITYGVKSDFCQDCEETIYENAIKSGISWESIYYHWVDIYEDDTYYTALLFSCIIRVLGVAE